MTPLEILNKNKSARFDLNGDPLYSTDEVIAGMKEYARQERDKALWWAAKNGETEWEPIYEKYVVDEDSILAGKTSPDLAI